MTQNWINLHAKNEIERLAYETDNKIEYRSTHREKKKSQKEKFDKSKSHLIFLEALHVWNVGSG